MKHWTKMFVARAASAVLAPLVAALAVATKAGGPSHRARSESLRRRSRRSRRSSESEARPAGTSETGLERLRGLVDTLVGGTGLRRGRRDPVRLSVGDTLDFWRVEVFEPDRLLRLSAEMKTPGRIWLQFEVDGDQAGTTLRQTAIFDFHGLAGLAYWYALYPVHQLIFEGMLRGIERAAIASPRGSVSRADVI